MEVSCGAVKMPHFFHVVYEPDAPTDIRGPATSNGGTALGKAVAAPRLD